MSLLTVTSLLVAITFTVLAFSHYNTYIRLLDEQNQAIWLSENILPIIEEDDAAHRAQESPSIKRVARRFAQRWHLYWLMGYSQPEHTESGLSREMGTGERAWWIKFQA